MLRTGQPVPAFSLPDQDGRLRTLEDLVSSGWLLLYFYPADFTPLCTAQACMGRDRHAELAAAGVTLAGISRQDVSSKRRFIAQHNLPFILLADVDAAVHKSFGVLALAGIVTRRVTYLITRDEAGIAVIADHHEGNLSISGHTRFMDRALQRVQARGITPAGS